MKKYWIDFTASVLIEAEDSMDAQENFWDWVDGDLAPSSVQYGLEHVQVDTIEEAE